VHGGLGPYLAVYLLTVRHWNQAAIGVAMSLAGLAGIAAQTPAGALVDATRAKRAVVVAAAAVVTVCSLALIGLDGFWPVACLQLATGAAGAAFGPAIAAISLGVVGHARFAQRNGRNEAFNHAGNVAASLAAGAAAYVWGAIVVFVLIALTAAGSLASVLAIPGGAIDHDRARGLGDGERAARPSSLGVLLANRTLLLFAACAFLFHLANAAMLPLVGQKLAGGDAGGGISLMSACIVAAQLVMVPAALLAGGKADQWGRKRLFLAGFAILPIRGVLYTLSSDPFWLVGVQLLDGIGAGLYGALFPLVVADLTRGTGRFNVSLGAVATGQGIGAALSNALAGAIVVAAGYSAAFFALAGIAALALALFWGLMPETGGGR